MGEQKFLSLVADMYKRVLRYGLQAYHTLHCTHTHSLGLLFTVFLNLHTLFHSLFIHVNTDTWSVFYVLLYHAFSFSMFQHYWTWSADFWCNVCSCIGEVADLDHEDCVTCEEGCQHCLDGQYIIIWMDVCTNIALLKINCITSSAKKDLLSQH